MPSRSSSATGCPEVDGYIEAVRSGELTVCSWQRKLCEYVARVFREEQLTVDSARLEGYLTYQKWFGTLIPGGLLPWERFLLALFLCTFDAEGYPRWPDLICFVGRGAGKNAFISFMAFCAMTKVNGIASYDVDICANSEEQAKRSFMDVYGILDGEHRLRFKQCWGWTLTGIENKTTGSVLKYRTNSPKSKDGMRSGMVIFDEVHQYTDWANVTVFTTGQGKVPHPRRAFISSNGNVREGVYDTLRERACSILDGERPDNGYLPFVCELDSAAEVHDPGNWGKANPSLYAMPDLRREIAKEYADWCDDPAGSADFMTKRMGVPQGDEEHQVATWEQLVQASREIPDLTGRQCVAGIDLARTTDFVSAVLLFKDNGSFYALHHSWFCTQSRDRSVIKPPLEEWAARGILTLVDDSEVHPSLVTDWLYEMGARYAVTHVAIDDYRYTLMMRELERIGYSTEAGNVTKVRPSNHMKVQPIINSAFVTGRIAWGDDPCMRWFANNVKLTAVKNGNGNYKYEKIEPRGRKTDGFMALVAAFCAADSLYEPEGTDELPAPIVW